MSVPLTKRSSTFSRTIPIDEGKRLKRRQSFYEKFPIDEVEKDLETDVKNGLTMDLVAEKLEEFGYNKLDKPPSRPFWKLFLDQFNDLLVILLLIASIVAAALGGYVEAAAIWAIVLTIAYVGATQEGKADDAIDALEALSAPKCSVRRDGQVQEVDSQTLVPGDIMLLRTGDRIPADGRIVQCVDFKVDESSITGESMPVGKTDDRLLLKEGALTAATKVYMGTEVSSGNANVVVTETGMQAEFIGKIVALLNTSGMGESPLQEKLHRLGEQLGYASIFVSLVVFIIGVTTERGADPNSDQPVWLQMLLIAVSLTVAAVPEGLPVCVTITLAMGMNRMAKRNALIRKLKSVETLGSANIIFTDKTGTLTVGKMTVTEAITSQSAFWKFTGQGYNPTGEIIPIEDTGTPCQRPGRADIDTILQCSALSSNSEISYDESKDLWRVSGNMTDKAIIVAARKGDCNAEDVGTRIHENAFDSTRKLHSIIVELKDGSKWVITKGAPDRVLDKASHYVTEYHNPWEFTEAEMDEKAKARFEQHVNLQSSQGKRCIVFAVKRFNEGEERTSDHIETDLTYLGLVAIQDPPRPEVKASIAEAQSAGVRVVMITGDYKLTAASIAQHVGIVPHELSKPSDIPHLLHNKLVVDCDEFRQWSEKDQETAVFNACAFARAKPEDKMTIIKHAQHPKGPGRRRMVCAMTGDGVNDAPAAKAADIGCAMGSGTSVCQSASDMIMANDSFECIVDAIKEGRRIYANISKFVYMLLSQNIAEVFLIFIASLLDLQSPLVPIQILWLNLMTDSLPALALANEEREPTIMRTPPRLRDASIIDKLMIVGIIIHNTVLVIVNLTAYIVGLYWHVGVWNGTLNCFELDEVCKESEQLGVRKAQTMVIYVIVFAELLRAYSARSLRESVFSLGLFSNKWMQYSVFSAIIITLVVGNVPGLRGIFDMELLDAKSWLLVTGMSIAPFIIDELVKVRYRQTGFGLPPRIVPEFGESYLRVKVTK